MSDLSKVWRQEVLRFWFEELEPKQWFQSSDELDATITSRFKTILEEIRTWSVTSLVGQSAEDALAAVIVLDQFSRNIYRKQAEAFAQDMLARTVSSAAIEQELDQNLEEQQRHFLYMPFMHAEDLDAQKRSLELFGVLGDENTLKFAREHYELVEQFGRFPYRNDVLGRQSSPEEESYLKDGKRYGQ